MEEGRGSSSGGWRVEGTKIKRARRTVITTTLSLTSLYIFICMYRKYQCISCPMIFSLSISLSIFEYLSFC